MIKNIIQNILSDVLSSPFGEFLAIVFKMAKSSIVNLTGEIGTFTRATPATVEDHEGVIREVLSGEVRFQGQRRVYNLAASTDTPSTQGVTVIVGRVYQISIGADSASGATAILTGAATGTLTGDAANGQSFDTAKTASTTTLTITISGSVKNLQVEDVTGQSNQAPASYVSKGTLSAPYHGTGIDGSKVFLTANGNSVSSGIITEAPGTAITDAIGYFGEPASTNKCTNYNANPDAGLTGLTKGGDAAATMTRVDDSTELAAAGLDAICTDGNVIKLDNSAGVGVSFIDIDGTTGNTNDHAVSGHWRGSGTGAIQITTDTSGSVAIPSTYTRTQQTLTPTGAGTKARLVVEAGGIGYFILNQMEEKVFATSEIITEGAAATRNKDDSDYPTTNIPVNDCVFTFDWTPTAAGQGTIVLFGAGTGAGANEILFLVDSTAFYMRKTIATVAHTATKTTAYSVDTTYSLKARFSSVAGIDIWVDDSKGTNNSNTVDAVLGTTIEMGERLGGTLTQTGGINNFTVHSGTFTDADVVSL